MKCGQQYDFHACCEDWVYMCRVVNTVPNTRQALSKYYFWLRYNLCKTCVIVQLQDLSMGSGIYSAVFWVLHFLWLRYILNLLPLKFDDSDSWCSGIYSQITDRCHCIRQSEHTLFWVILILDGLQCPSSLRPYLLFHLTGAVLSGECQKNSVGSFVARAAQGKV